MTPARPGVGAWAVSDGELMAQVTGGSREALGELYDRYSDRAYGLAFSICADSGRAQDAMQEGFLAVWKSSRTYRPEKGPVDGWLLAVIRNRTIDLLRRNAIDSSRRASEAHLSTYPAPDDVCEDVLSRDTAHRLQAVLAVLPAGQREVIVLAFYGGLTHAQISAQLSLPPGTVKGRMRLGLKKLHTAIQPQVGNSPVRVWATHKQSQGVNYSRSLSSSS